MTDDLPEGWALTRIGDVFEANPRKPAADFARPDTPVAFVPMNAVDAARGAIVTPEERPFGAVRKGYTAFADGDVLLAKITPCFENGKAAVASSLRNGLGFGSSEFHVFRPRGAVLAPYLFHFLRQPQLRADAAEFMTGTAGQERVPIDHISNLELPIAPLAEQLRIVAKVEALLEQVRRAKDRLDRVPLVLKRFRQAVLSAACSGALTEEWRASRSGRETPATERLRVLEMHRQLLWERRNRDRSSRRRSYRAAFEPVQPEGVDLPEGWTWTSVSALALLDVGFAFPSSGFRESGIRLLRGENIAPGTLRWADTKCWPQADLDPQRHLFVEAGEIILGMDRPLVAAGLKIARAKAADLPAVLVQRVMRFKMVDQTDTDFLFLCLSERRFIDFLAHDGMTGSDLPHITGTGVAEFSVPLPPKEEQVEIVRRVDSLLSYATAIENRVEQAAALSDRLPQAILSKAFAGELVPTEADLARSENRDYETAQQLLERVRVEANEEAATPKRSPAAALRARSKKVTTT